MNRIRTEVQNKQLHALLGKLNIEPEVKQELVYSYTNGRTTSSSKMLPEECQALINHLNVLVSQKDEAANKMRRKILSICYELKLIKDNKVDMQRLDDWLCKSSYLKKSLNKYTYLELPKLVSQFEQILKSHYAKL